MVQLRTGDCRLIRNLESPTCELGHGIQLLQTALPIQFSDAFALVVFGYLNECKTMNVMTISCSLTDGSQVLVNDPWVSSISEQLQNQLLSPDTANPKGPA